MTTMSKTNEDSESVYMKIMEEKNKSPKEVLLNIKRNEMTAERNQISDNNT